MARDWATRGLDAAARAALESGLPGAELTSLLLEVANARAAARSAGDLMAQAARDRFVAPCGIDQRTLRRLDLHLLDAAQAFEAVELSPLAPLGVCSVVAPVSQRRIVTTLRGSEVVADPTSVLALLCAQRLRHAPDTTVRLATTHRCVRAQSFPDEPGFAAHFAIFCLASAAHERADQAFAVDALAEHIALHHAALRSLAYREGTVRGWAVRLLSTAACRALAERIEAALQPLPVEHAALDSPYYDGLRFMIDALMHDGSRVLIGDGGRFDWLHRLASNHKLTLVASGSGAQRVAAMLEVSTHPSQAKRILRAG